nr:diguanylate cyclase [Shewanella marina]
MQHLAVKERYLVSHLLGEKNFIYRDYLNIENLIFEQQQTLYYAYIVANPKRKELIQQLYNSKEQKKLIEFRQLMQRQADIVEQAQRIGNSLGYGGLMHDYKNFLLTGLPSYAEDFARHPSKVNVQLAQLQNQKLSPKQQQATSEIEQKIAEYQQQMLALKKLKEENLPIHEINQRTKIDEQALTKALHYLQNPPLLIEPLQWQQVTSARLNHIQQITASISDYMYRLANKQQSYVLFSLLSYLIIGSSILIVSLLILRTIIKNLMNKINLIVDEMSRMAQDPKLDLILNIDGKDELNQMVESFNHMVIERQKASHYLRQAAAVFKYASEGIIVTDANNNIELINPAFTDITGYSIEEIRGKNPSILQSKRHSQAFYEDFWRSLNSTGKWEGEIWNTRKNGQVYPEYLAITLVRNDQGEVIQHLGMFLDISNRKQYEQNIWFQAHFDTLTELPNRKLFNDRLNSELTLAKKHQRKLAIILIDLDRFKNINDTLGHHFGDELLKQVALRLNNALEKRPFVARFSGDEFAILITDYDHDIEIDHNIKQLMDSFALSFKLDNEDIIISASMGVALYPQDGLDHKSITSNAETAMYQAKEMGRNSYKYFTAGMNSNLLERMTIEQKLRKAVMQSEFCLHYQPIVDMSNGHIIGLEALIRWIDPVVGIIPPDTFITIAEETGMIETIGAWYSTKRLLI